MAEAPSGFGSGLGTLIGDNMAANELQNAQSHVDSTGIDAQAAVNKTTNGFIDSTDPYNSFGKSFLEPATGGVTDVSNAAKSTQGYNQFMAGYTNTPAAQYQLQQADQVQENSAAAKGGLLAGSNLRALSTINSGIVAQNANTAYDEYLKGSSTGFGQLETSLGNMFSAIGVGQTATGQQEALDAAQIGATASIAGANMGATSKLGSEQAKNDQSKGSGFGSMFGGLGFAGF